MRLPSPLARYLGAALQRVGARLTATSAAVQQTATASPGMARARAALADARQHMPGLVSPASKLAAAPVEAEGNLVVQSPAENAARNELAVLGDQDLRLARAEEVVVRLEQERHLLQAEVAGLRLIAEELRETLVRLDERAASHHSPAELSESETATSQPLLPPEPIYAAGSVGVDLHLTGLQDRAALEQIRLAVAGQPEIDEARTIRAQSDEATLRIYLRFPMGRRAFIDLIGRVAPAAKPLAGPAPGTLLLRLRSP